MESYDQRLQGKDVVVIANGIEYRGTLMAITEEEVYLMTILGYVNLPVDRVSVLRDANAACTLEPTDVDPSYFDEPSSED